MSLIKRQAINYEIYDDQSPTLWNSFSGNWTRYEQDGFNNNTVTATPTPGAYVSFTFSGSQAWLYGGLLTNATNNQIVSYPTADYKVDGFSAGTQKPWYDAVSGEVVYFQTPVLADGTHKIEINVTTANSTNLFILDAFLITPSTGGDHSGVSTSRGVPAPSSTSSSIPIVTSKSTPVGAIVGGVVGGIAGIAILALALWYFLRKRTSSGQAYYFDKPTPGDLLAGEDHVEPFNAAVTTPAPSSAGFSQGPQSAYSDGSSQPLNQNFRQTLTDPSRYSQSGPSEPGQTYVSGSSGQPRVGKAALIAQQHQVQPPVQLEDSGIRFNENGEQEAGPSHLPTEVPPTYTPN
jgi:hypothetical protein